MSTNETRSKLYLVPLVASLVFVVGLSSTYIIAVVLGHVEPILPYISDAGATPPENSLFSQVFNVYCAVAVFAIYIHFREVGIFLKTIRSRRLRFLNHFSFWLEIVSVAALSVVGNCPTTTLFIVHSVGAAISIPSHVGFMWIQVVFDNSLGPQYATRNISRLRTLLTIIATVAIAICPVAGKMSLDEFKGKNWLLWKPEDGGYEMHVLSTACEWIFFLAHCAWTTTFTKQFGALKLHRPQISISSHEVEKNFKKE